MSASKIVKYVTAALLLSGWSASAAQYCEELNLYAAATLALELPDYIGDLEFNDDQLHEDPRLGYAVTYIDDGVRLDIYFYDYGFDDIPDGINSRVLREHYEEVKAGLKESGAYSRITLQSEREVSLGAKGIPALEAHYLLQDGQRRLLSFIYLTAKYGEFVKVRLSLPVERQSETTKLIDAVFSELAKVLCGGADSVPANGTTILAAIKRMLGAKTVVVAMDEIETVMTYVASDPAPVQVVLNEQFFQFTDDILNDSFFMAFYLAGAIKFDLENPSASRDPGADVLPAIRATITALRIYQSGDPYYEHPFIEKLAKLDKAGELEAFVRSRH